MAIEEVDKFEQSEDAEDIPGAVAYFLEELERGPFAPALAGDALERFRIQSKLVDFIKAHLANQVVLISNQTFSPVGRPALALSAQLRNPEYWRRFRLSSLYRVWPNIQVDIGALTRQSNDEISFAKRFPLGLKVHGRVLRRTYGATGFIVEADINGTTVPCLLPKDSLPSDFCTDPEAIIGQEGVFEIASILPAKQSVLLHVLKLSHTEVKMPQSRDSSARGADVERRLVLVKSWLDQGLISEAVADEKRREILADL